MSESIIDPPSYRRGIFHSSVSQYFAFDFRPPSHIPFVQFTSQITSSIITHREISLKAPFLLSRASPQYTRTTRAGGKIYSAVLTQFIHRVLVICFQDPLHRETPSLPPNWSWSANNDSFLSTPFYEAFNSVNVCSPLLEISSQNLELGPISRQPWWRGECFMFLLYYVHTASI